VITVIAFEERSSCPAKSGQLPLRSRGAPAHMHSRGDFSLPQAPSRTGAARLLWVHRRTVGVSGPDAAADVLAVTRIRIARLIRPGRSRDVREGQRHRQKPEHPL
jgi:hypothetical protein